MSDPDRPAAIHAAFETVKQRWYSDELHRAEWWADHASRDIPFLIGEAERLRGRLRELEWAGHKTRGGFDSGSPMRILLCCPVCEASVDFPHRNCWLAAEIGR